MVLILLPFTLELQCSCHTKCNSFHNLYIPISIQNPYQLIGFKSALHISFFAFFGDCFLDLELVHIACQIKKEFKMLIVTEFVV